MDSIIDDFNILYNSIINDIITDKNKYCDNYLSKEVLLTGVFLENFQDTSEGNSEGATLSDNNNVELSQTLTEVEITKASVDKINEEIKLATNKDKLDKLNKQIKYKNNIYDTQHNYDTNSEGANLKYDCSKSIYHINYDDIMYKLSIRNDNNISIIGTYLKNIYISTNKVLQQFNVSNSENVYQLNENSENVKSNIHIQINSLNNRISYLQIFTIVMGIIMSSLVGYISYYIIKPHFRESISDLKTRKKFLINPMTTITILVSVFYTLIYQKITNNINIINNKVNALKNISESVISNILHSLLSLKSDLESVLQLNKNTDNAIFISNLKDKGKHIASNLEQIIKQYKQINKYSLINNDNTKNIKIADINKLFITLKDISYIHNNKFNNLAVDNHNELECLLKLILIKDESEYNDDITVHCSFNNNSGLKGLYDSQYIDDENFNNGLEHIDIDKELNGLFELLRNQVIDRSLKYKFNKSKIYKVISNLFNIKIKYYNITQNDCIKYIYHYFAHIDLKKYNITISRFELINNYKILINMIYDHYNIFTKTENETIHNVPSYIISKAKFNQIINIYNINEINSLSKVIQNTIIKINDFNSIYNNEILQDIHNEKQENNNLLVLSMTVFAISGMQFYGHAASELEKILSGGSNNNNKKNNSKVLQSSSTPKLLQQSKPLQNAQSLEKSPLNRTLAPNPPQTPTQSSSPSKLLQQPNPALLLNAPPLKTNLEISQKSQAFVCPSKNINVDKFLTKESCNKKKK